MADAENKKISELDFGIDNAIKKLNTIDNKLKEISQTSEKYAKTIGDALNQSVNNGITIDTKNIQQDMNEILSQDKVLKRNLILQNNTHNNKIKEMNHKTTLKQMEDNNKILKSTQTISDKIANYAKTYLIYQGFNQLKQAVSETIDEMVELEYQMVSIDRVLNEDTLDLNAYRDDLLQLAYDYGNEMDNVTDVALRLAQAGYDSNEVLALTEKTLLALNTAELDATQATSDMIAVMAQWGLMTGTAEEQAEQYGDIIDKINIVADRYPTTSEDLMDALKKTSSAFNLAGASIEETIALITTAEVASQRGGKAIGTALGNITQQLKDEGRLTIAESLGLDFYTDETKTEFKDIMDIFAEMSEKMQELKNAGKENSVEMQNLLSIFTVFRRNIGASVLSGMSDEVGTYEDVLETLNDSLGYSLQENEKHMKTAKAAQAQFNDELLKLKTEVWDNGLEDVYRSLLSAGNGFVEWIIKLSKNMKLLPATIALVTAAFSLLGKKISAEGLKKYKEQVDSLRKAFKTYNETVSKGQKVGDEFYETIDKESRPAVKKYLESVKGAGAGFKDYAVKALEAKAAQVALNLVVAAGEALISFGLSLAVQAIVTGISDWIHATEKAAESMEEAMETLTESETTLNSYVENFQTLREEMASGDLTQEEFNKKKQELKTIEEELIDLYGDEAEGLDLVNGSIETQINKIEELGQQDYLKYVQENYKDIVKTIDAVEKDINKNTTLSSSKNLWGNYSDIEEYKDKVEELLKNVANIETYDFGIGKNLVIEANGTAEEVAEAYREAFNKIEEYSKEASGEEQEFLNKSLERISKTISSLDEKYSDSIKEYNNFLLKRLQYDSNYSENYAKILEARAELETAIETGSLEDVEKAKEKIANAYGGAIETAAKDPLVAEGMTKLLTEQLNNVNEEIEKNKIGLKIGIKSDELYDSIQDVLDEMGDISSEDFKSFFNTGKLTENMQKLKDILDENGISVENFIKWFDYLGFTLGETNENVKKATDSNITYGNVTFSMLDTLIDKYGEVTAAVDEYNRTGSLTYDTLNTLINNDLLQYLDLTSDKLAINEAAFANAASAAKANAMYQLAAQAATQIAAIAYDEESSAVNGASATTEGMSTKTKDIYNKLIEVIPEILNGADAWTKYNEAMANVDISGISDEATLKIKNIVTNLASMTTSLNNIKVSSVSYARTSAKSSGSSSSSSSSDAEKAAEEEYKKKLALFTDYIDELEEKEQRWVKKQKELGVLSYEDERYIIQQRIARYEKYLNQIKNMTWLSTEDRLKLEKEYTEEIEDLQLDYMGLLKDELDDEIDAIEKANKEKIEAIEDSADDRIDKLKEENKAAIELIEKEADARISALKAVEDENDRIRAKEEYERNRKEHLDDISYWEQRTGREAQEALLEARKALEDLDREWEEQLEDWKIEDQIAEIEEKRDAEIEAIEAAQEKEIESIETTRDAEIAAIEAAQEKEIAALQEVYDAKVKMYSETNKIIYDASQIQSQALYETYKTNFIDPISSELKKMYAQAPTATTQSSYETYTIKRGDTLSGIASRYGTTVSKLMEANPYIKNKNLIYSGNTLQIPKFHEGGIVGGNQEAFALLKPNEVVLKTEWAASLNRMMKYFDNLSMNNSTVVPGGPNIEVNGDLIKIEATVRNQNDINNIEKRVEKVLKDKFNIKK